MESVQKRLKDLSSSEEKQESLGREQNIEGVTIGGHNWKEKGGQDLNRRISPLCNRSVSSAWEARKYDPLAAVGEGSKKGETVCTHQEGTM